MGGGPVSNIDEVSGGLHDLSLSGAPRVPADSAEANVTIQRVCAKVSLLQHFTLPDREILGEIVLPIAPDAALVGVECRQAAKGQCMGEWRRATLLERDHAKQVFNSALQKHHAPVLAMANTDLDIVRFRLGCLPAGAALEVRLTYVEPVRVVASEVDDLDTLLGDIDRSNADAAHRTTTSSIEWVFPTHVAPRFGSPGPGPNVTPVSLPRDSLFRVSVEFAAACAVTDADCPTHKSGWTPLAAPRVGGTWEGRELGGSLVVRAAMTEQPFTPTAIVEYDPKTNTHACALSLLPKFDAGETCVELVVVVDCSGSMDGDRIHQASLALSLLLRSLPSTSFINIVRFGASTSTLFPGGSEPASSRAVATALELANGLRADMGGTCILEALQHTLSLAQRPNTSRRVLVLTDGLVDGDVVERVRVAVRQWARQRGDGRLFALGLGADVSRALVQGIATDGRGDAAFVTDGTRLAGTVMDLAVEALRPTVTNLHVNWHPHDPATHPPTPPLDPSPMSPPPLSSSLIAITPLPSASSAAVWPSPRPGYGHAMSSRVLTAWALIPKGHPPPSHVTISAETAGGKVFEASGRVVSVEGVSGVHVLAVRSLVADIHNGTSFLTQPNAAPCGVTPPQQRPREYAAVSSVVVQRLAVELCLRHHVASSNTAWVLPSSLDTDDMARSDTTPPHQRDSTSDRPSLAAVVTVTRTTDVHGAEMLCTTATPYAVNPIMPGYVPGVGRGGSGFTTRSDVAGYLRGLDVNSALYDPKARSMPSRWDSGKHGRDEHSARPTTTESKRHALSELGVINGTLRQGTPSGAPKRGADALMQIYGTEQDKTHCPFFVKTGVCRHGERCSRLHTMPQSRTVVLRNWAEAGADTDELYLHLHAAMAQWPHVEMMMVCVGGVSTWHGNTYIRFTTQDVAAAVQRRLDGTMLLGRRCDAGLVLDDVPTCRQLGCLRGDKCAFMHVRQPSQALSRRLSPVVLGVGDGGEDRNVGGQCAWSVTSTSTPSLVHRLGSPLDRIAAQQRSDGCFPCTPSLSATLGLPWPLALPPPCPLATPDIWTTALTLATLQLTMPHQRREWRLFGGKALAYMTATVGSEFSTKLVGDAQAALAAAKPTPNPRHV